MNRASGTSVRIIGRMVSDAEEHGFRRPPRAQQPVGEDVAALAVARELNLVHADELDLPIQGHRFDGADKIAGILRDSPLLPRHQGERACSPFSATTRS